MKRTLLATVLLSSMAITASAEIVGDTLVIEEVKKVKIETRDTVQRIVISGSKDDSQFQYVQRISIPDTSAVRRTIKSVKDFNKISIDKKNQKWEGSSHLNIGLNTMTNVPDGYDFKVWPSFEIGLAVTADYRPYGKQNKWSFGLGVYWRNYRSSNDNFWAKDANDCMTLVPYTVEKDTRTSLQVFSVGVPIMYTHYFDSKQKWGLTLGAIVNWNAIANGYREYELNGEDYEVETKKIGQRPITVDGLVIAHIPSLPDLYCKYCPMTMFKDGRGPKVHQLSFGFYW